MKTRNNNVNAKIRELRREKQRKVQLRKAYVDSIWKILRTIREGKKQYDSYEGTHDLQQLHLEAR